MKKIDIPFSIPAYILKRVLHETIEFKKIEFVETEKERDTKKAINEWKILDVQNWE